jgi:two-component system sensor kinase FixL
MDEGPNATALLAQIVRSSEDAIISKTLDGIITSWNAGAQKLFGYSAEETVGRSISIIFPPDRLAEEEEILQQIKAGQGVEPYETVRRHKDGYEIQISVAVAPLRDAAGKIVGASKIARDITGRKTAEQHAVALQNELAHVGRLSAMGQMSAAIAHELNQPLAAIANYVKAAQRLLEPEIPTAQQLKTAREAVEKAAGQTIRAGTIIRYLREFMEKRDSERRLEDLNRVIREAVTLGTVGAHHGDVQVKLDLAAGIPPVSMDRVQIQQVLLNLIRNAMEAMAESGKRELSIASVHQADNFVAILVRDTGPGLSPAVREKLFQPFVTTKSQGMGIGLKICQSIVEAHGGIIRVLDEAGGATFQIQLPLSSAGASAGSSHDG